MTAIKLNSFTATGSEAGRVLLQWQTGFEVDNLGFNIYREQGGARLHVNPHIIAGSALLVGAGTTLGAGHAYTWWDESSPGSENARYWLEDIDLSGQSTWHGPVTVVPSTSPAPPSAQAALLHSLGQGAAQQSLSGPAERRVPLAPLTAPPAATLAVHGAEASSGTPSALAATGLSTGQWLPAAQAAVKLAVRQEGWYRVTQPALVAAGLPPQVDPRLLHLYVDGREVPMRITGQEDGRFTANEAIEFYGLGLDESWTDTRVYWLVVDSTPGRRISQAPAQSGQGSARSFPYTVERRERTIYFSALRNGEEENFFGAVVSQRPLTQSLLGQRLDPAPPGATRLHVALQGVTRGTHRVRVTLNGVSVGTVTFQDQGAGAASFVVAPSSLREGQNQIELTAQGGAQDISLVETLRLTYWHTYMADNDVLRFSGTARQQVTVGGFRSASIRVMDITAADAVQEVTGVIKQQGAQFTVSLTVPGSGARTLLAFTPGQAKSVAAVTANRPSRWRQPGQGADLVMISHRAFLSSLAPLRQWRERQGLRVAVVDVEDLYDEFSYGQKTPYAVQDFLAYAQAQWKPVPRFVLLVGDASLDPKNYLGAGDSDFVPTKLIETASMETASDDWFADFTGDGVAAMAVGRLPVRTAQDAARLVAKIIGYEQTGAASGVLLVAGPNNGADDVTDQLQALLPAHMAVEAIDLGQTGLTAGKRQLLQSLNRGPALVNYVGHGSVNLWTGSVLTADEAHGLRNGRRLSIVLPMTCLNGYFHDPILESLGEALLNAEGGGAAAVWASSGMTGPGDQAVMNQALYQVLFMENRPKGAPLTFGEAVMRAKAAVSNGDVRRTWILLGDPAMTLTIR